MEIIIGVISGMVTAIGMGGGTVLILLLTLFLGVPQHIAQATNLIFFVHLQVVFQDYLRVYYKHSDYQRSIDNRFCLYFD